MSKLSAQIAAATIAQRTVGAPGGAPVDIQQVQAGIRAGAAGGLSELEVSRAAIEAIRTGSEDIFLNTETVLSDLRVVAAATGVAFEDATRRFFRGIIKREQELLDELGIIARVEAANERYARSIGVATSELTVQQEQLAFAAEVQRQVTVLAQSYGRTSVLETQRATAAANRLRAEWQNFFADFGASQRGNAERISAIGIGLLQVVRFATGIRQQQGVEVQQVSNLNRLEGQRNTLLTERLGILSKAAQAGSIDVRQQQNLIRIQGDILTQQERIFGARGIGPPDARFSAQNIERAETSRLEERGIVSRLAENRRLSRIAALQAPAAAALSAIESFGFEVGRLPEGLRLSADQVRNLLEGTGEATVSIAGLAAVFDLPISRVIELIKAMGEEVEGLSDSVDFATLNIERSRLRLERITRPRGEAGRLLDRFQREGTFAGGAAGVPSGPVNFEIGRFFGNFNERRTTAFIEGLAQASEDFRALSVDLQEFGDALPTSRVIASGEFFAAIPGLRRTGLAAEPLARSGDPAPPDILFDQANRRQRAQQDAIREVNLQADISLTAVEQFAELAANMGLTLDTMQSNLASFVTGIAFQGQSLRQALVSFLQNIASTLVQSTIRDTIGQNFGGLFTNAVTRGPASGGVGSAVYNTVNNIGIANPLQARSAATSARILEGIGP